MSDTLRVRFGHLALVMPYAAAVILAYLDYQRDPFDPSLAGTAQYGHNSEGILQTFMILATVELVVALAVLRPGSYERSWGRALAACVLFTVWAAASMMLAMHGGGVLMIHLLYVLALALGCFVTLLWSLLARRAR